MAIEKMKLLSLVGARGAEHDILQELVLCEKIHIDLEHSDTYGNNYILHEYEAMLPVGEKTKEVGQEEIIESQCQEALGQIEYMAEELEVKLHTITEDIKRYTRKQELED